MSHFKTISSISPHGDDRILQFLLKHHPEIQGIPRNKNSKTPLIYKEANPHLDQIIDAVDDQINLKELDKTLPDDLEQLDHLSAPKITETNKILWRLFSFVQPKENTLQEIKRAIGVRKLLMAGTIFAVKRLTKIFITYNLQKLAVSKIDRHFQNGKIAKWFDDEIEKVYQEHPDYQPMNINQFKKTSVWERNASEWREKTKKQIIRRLSSRMLTILITYLCGRIPFPGAFLYSIPARIILAYLGVRLAVGSINTMVVEHNGNSLFLGVSLTKYGFELVNPELFVTRKSDGKMVRVFLPKLPKEFYQITDEDLKAFEKENTSLDELKKRLDVIHDRMK